MAAQALPAAPSGGTPAPLPAWVAPRIDPEKVDGKAYDVVVVGGTPGGIACAVRAAREGLSVLLVNHTQHLGGFITSGAGGWEAPYDGRRSPIYSEILDLTAAYYAKTYGEGSRQHIYARPLANTNSHFDRPKVEPKVAEMIFDRMITEAKTIDVLRGFIVESADRKENLLDSVTLREMHGKKTCRVSGKVFVDAMYEGDLVAAAKVPSQIGREPRSKYNEPHAGVLFMNERKKEPGQLGFPKDAAEGRLKTRYNSHGTGDILPESTGDGDGSVMAYNYRLILTNNPANRIKIEKPEGYSAEVASKVHVGNYVPNVQNDKVGWNGGRLVGPQNEYPGGDWETRERVAKHYLDRMLGMIWYVQNDPSAPPDARKRLEGFGLAADEFVDNNHIPYEIYVREARRLIGRFVFTEHDGLIAPGLERTPIHSDSIAITDWPIDSVACTTRRAGDSHEDGIFFLAEESRPAQVPYRCLLAKEVDNLLVPVALSASHVGWGCIRLEPVWLQAGEAAGFAASIAIKTKTTPAKIDSDALLRELIAHKTMITFFNDVDVASDEPWVQAVEFLGTKGFFRSYNARAANPLSAQTAAAWAAIYAKLAKGKDYDPTEEARTLPVDDVAPTGLTAAEFFEQLKTSMDKAGVKPDGIDAAQKKLGLTAADPISRGDACRLMYLGLASE